MRERAVYWAPLGLVAVVLARAFAATDGQIGHDFDHQFTRLLLGADHFWRNGLSVPHYTASLCGGVPFFADPQSMYYSLPQWLTFLVAPWPATLLSLAAFYAFGYAGALWLFRRLELGQEAGHLGALAFVTSGFAFAHLYVGHLTHHTFLLLPWALGLWLGPAAGRPASPLRDAAWAALLVGYVIWSGGVHIAIVAATMLLIATPWAWHRRQADARSFLVFVALSAAMSTLVVLGKATAAMRYAPHFYSMPIDRTSDSVLTQVLRYFWFVPARSPEYLPFGRFRFGAWEFVGFVTRLALPAVGLVAWQSWRTTGPLRRTGLLTAALVLAICLAATARLGNESLPFLRHYHNPLKLMGALVPLVACACAFAADRLFSDARVRSLPDKTRATLFLFLGAILFYEFVAGTGFFTSRRLGLSANRASSDSVHHLIRSKGLPPVAFANQTPGSDLAGLALGQTSIRCYEPLFGYRDEALLATVKGGPTSTVRDARFNLTHPGCLLYSSHFACQPWDRIPEAEAPAYARFVQGLPAWGVPLWQTAALWISALSLLLLGGWLLFPSVSRAWLASRRGAR